MGLGLLGRGVGDVAFLAEEGADLIVTDLKTKSQLMESLEKLKKFKNIKYTLGKHDFKDFENRDFILKSAGVPIESPYIKHASNNKVPVFMSTALFAKLTPAKVIGITGTRGKTTVTQMVYHILRKNYSKTNSKVYIGGNIQGMATLPLIRETKKGDLVVLELDSWQLQGFGDLKISPEISVFTTFMPDHLNYYKGDLKVYFLDKLNIFKYQKNKDIAVAGEQLCRLPSFFTRLLPKHTRFFDQNILPKKVELKIPGDHNLYNASLAFAVARKLKVPIRTIVESLNSFSGVPGRLEKLKTFRGISIYNDTTATTPNALVSALSALGVQKNIVLIMGGADKGIDLKDLKEPLEKYTKSIILLSGTGTDRLKREKILPTVPIFEFDNFNKAVKKAFNQAKKGDILLLSPGFASFGMFINEYDRGEKFNRLVKLIK